ncbi:hypothetical protein [Enterococcus nangangensis]|uniref:hypothetical protein n=1 Tax=Enterococcus nangangensis TaxID=2559926 RepID=UPI0010F57BB8|nr:hypothetical protein [Enterococcus nangangensis]
MKKIGIMSFLLLSFLVVGSSKSHAEESAEGSAVSIKVEYKSHILEWRFKNIGGYAYKRQYDCTADKWLGEWVRV